MLLRSALLDEHGFAHGFSLRTGGVSAPPFDTLNLARAVGDDPAHVSENHRRFAHAVGYTTLFETSQVHGAEVAEVHAEDDVLPVRMREADALVTASRGLAVGVRVADCLPLLIADVRRGAVAAVHAGWRGVVAGVVDRALDSLGGHPSELVVAIGPHIRVGAFEVGDDVAAQLHAVAPEADAVVRGRPKPHVDLAKLVRGRLARRGVLRVDDVGGCTQTEPERFHSFRRDGKQSGRHLAVIVAR